MPAPDPRLPSLALPVGADDQVGFDDLLSGRAALASVLSLPFVVSAIRSVARGASGADLIPVLGLTGRVQLLGGLAMAAGLALTG